MFESGGGRPSGDELLAKELEEATGADPLGGLRRPELAGGLDDDDAAATAVSTRSKASRAAVGDGKRDLLDSC